MFIVNLNFALLNLKVSSMINDIVTNKTLLTVVPITQLHFIICSLHIAYHRIEMT